MTAFLTPRIRYEYTNFRGKAMIKLYVYISIEPMKSFVVFQSFPNISGLLSILNFEDSFIYDKENVENVHGK